MSKKTYLTGYRSRGGSASIESLGHIKMYPGNFKRSFHVPDEVSSATEAIKLLKMLVIASPYKKTKVTPVYS